MERGLVLLLPLCLGLLPRGHGQALEVEPPGPAVAVALGGSLQLTCRLACARGAAASVQWRGLDTSLGAVQSDARSSVLAVRNASLSAAGTRVCVGSCGQRTFQSAVQLLVYAFPDQLSMSPAALVPGRGQEVACTAHNVTPIDPDALSFALLLGERELGGVQDLGREEEPLEDEDMLFHVTQRWLLPPLGASAPAALHCQATMKLPGLELSHRRPIPVLHGPAALEPSSTAAQEPPTTAAMEPPSTAAQEPLSTAAQEPPSTATQKPPTMAAMEPPTTATHKSPSMAAQEPPSMAAQEPPTTDAMEPPSTAAQEPPSMAAQEPCTMGTQSSTHYPSSPGPRSWPSLARPCRPEIYQLPAPTDGEARSELLCVAACGSGVAVRWAQAPGGLGAYERREAGPRAWLTPLQAGRAPEGWFRCRLHPGGQMSSLYVVPESRSRPDAAAAAALWPGSSVLALLLLALLAHRLRRRCRSCRSPG
ncbi:mucosal addressin cell adhesion molecule 1 isoform X2 [Choloepus didactylus]|uniref:mucosal addressin cell adhesion molecule 1 isoform X2 n=1 Tax=Choloepus didactylus TaxID=27675 RepID=UPI00189D2BFC|nr:mucosal addressin cell adhesion molecule 1 isoform X2 [Choloepus didactylus]